MNTNIFIELYNDWFDNKTFWFSQLSENDIYLSNKYFKYINDTDYIFNNCYNDKILIISSIIMLDQIPRHYKRIYDKNIAVDFYTKKAIKFSELIINNNFNLNINELCFIYLPYRHLNDINKIYKIINLFIDLYNNSTNNDDKSTCKKYIYHTLNNIYKIININNYSNKIFIKNFDQINKNIFDNNSLQYYFSSIDNYTTDIYLNFLNQLHNFKDNSTIIVSLSGGVDSIVSLFILNLLSIQKPNIIKKIIAIHINYNNRPECNDELDFVAYFCDSLNIKLIYRTINEIKRSDCLNNGLRDLYEDITKKIRFDMYKYAYLYSNDIYVLLGHNKDDCFENIITNIINKKNYDNLSGMDYITKIDGINFWRPMLNISKNSIIKFANNNNLPYLSDSTPKWSTRGKIRDNLVPLFNNIKNNSIESFFDLKNYIYNSNEIINKIIINNLCSKLVNSDSYIYDAFYNIDELSCFKYINISILFFKKLNIFSSYKSFKEFSNYVYDYINNFKVKKFILNKNCNIILKPYFNNYQFNINLS
tara:strand:- start:3296 stop:4897 length:1602 start_codon:yes stop_codon:yes gene_type:complete